MPADPRREAATRSARRAGGVAPDTIGPPRRCRGHEPPPPGRPVLPLAEPSVVGDQCRAERSRPGSCAPWRHPVVRRQRARLDPGSGDRILEQWPDVDQPQERPARRHHPVVELVTMQVQAAQHAGGRGGHVRLDERRPLARPPQLAERAARIDVADDRAIANPGRADGRARLMPAPERPAGAAAGSPPWPPARGVGALRTAVGSARAPPIAVGWTAAARRSMGRPRRRP
jgi:hypothetical protein